MKTKNYLFLSILFLQGCSFIDTSRIAPGYSQALEAISKVYMGYPDTINADLVAEIPYASMKLRFGNGPTGLTILESLFNYNYTWVSSDGVILIIRNGKIIETARISNNLKATVHPFNNPFEQIRNAEKKLTYKGYLSFLEPNLNELEVFYSYEHKGKQKVMTTLGEKNFYLIEERFNSPVINWKGTNKYWVDDDNFVMLSEQSISPRLPVAYLEVTKKPSI